MKTTQRRTAIPYRDALKWLINNDDICWLDDGPDSSPSVTSCLIADIYGRTDAEVRADLERERARFERKQMFRVTSAGIIIGGKVAAA